MTADELLKKLTESGTGREKIDKAEELLEEEDLDAVTLVDRCEREKLWPEGTVEKARAFLEEAGAVPKKKRGRPKKEAAAEEAKEPPKAEPHKEPHKEPPKAEPHKGPEKKGW